MRRVFGVTCGIAILSGCAVQVEGSDGSAAAEAEAEGETSQAVLAYSTLGFPYDVLPVEIKNVNSGKCLDVSGSLTAPGSNVAQYSCSAGKNQTWFLVNISGTTDYEIRAGHVGSRNLDVAGGGSANNANVQIYDSGSVQRWGFVKQADGSYEIVAKASEKCLDVINASTADVANVQQFTCSGAANQRWTITPRATPLSLIAKHSQRCIDVAGGSTATNANIQQYDCFGASNQRWYIQGAGVGADGVQYWSLVSLNSGKCMDVADASAANNANIQQYPCTGTDNQKWAITTSPGTGLTTFRNKLSQKCLDVAGADTANNANVQQYTCGNGDNQNFYWANFAERHVQVVNVASSAGTGALSVSDAAILGHVNRANSMYQRYGTKLDFTAASDRSTLNNDAIFHFDSSSSTVYTCPDGSHGTSLQCATLYAANFPGKIVVFMRPGNGESWGDRNHIVIGAMQSGTVCGDVPDTQWLGHELGHYLGLAHTHAATFSNLAGASSYLQSHGNLVSAFDGDALSDTRPDPFYTGSECLAPHAATGSITLTNSSGGAVPMTIDTNNVMGYHYNAAAQITSAQQAPLTRATSYARFF
jgi:hypothetical protein